MKFQKYSCACPLIVDYDSGDYAVRKCCTIIRGIAIDYWQALNPALRVWNIRLLEVDRRK
ncbi:hypothetical protein [Pseudomonas fluorescens]|uniref:hypothetical protein n=1 Tax=Pseudomonas fluorescens TaxID=294 RepID=UPI00123FB5C5|nr:hypothetical protein [Pseudomonas fluorescens]